MVSDFMETAMSSILGKDELHDFKCTFYLFFLKDL